MIVVLLVSLSLSLSLKSSKSLKSLTLLYKRITSSSSFSLKVLQDKQLTITTSTPPPPITKNIVIIAGFESFNKALYTQAANEAKLKIPYVNINIFTDNDIDNNANDVDIALQNCNVLLCSLIFDYNQVQFIKEKVSKYNIPVRFCFESALELMSETKVGDFTMGGSGQMAGPPPAVKAILSQFGSKKEEDRISDHENSDEDLNQKRRQGSFKNSKN
jgi:hypothetical protein